MSAVKEEVIRNAVDLYQSLGSKARVAEAMDVSEAAVRRYLRRAAALNINPSSAMLDSDQKPAIVQHEPSDPVEVRRLKDKVALLESALRIAERRAVAAEDIRGGIAGLFSDPPQPKHVVLPAKQHAKAGEIPILSLFDLQWGEVVDLDKMDGLNSYNADIAANRLARYFNKAIDLCTGAHWASKLPAPKAYLVLGGDLVSGSIHDELVKTNDRSPIEAVRDLVSNLIGGIERFAASMKCPIEIISLPGNHGRITQKRESKRYVVDSYDTLVAWLLELHFNKPGSKIIVTAPASGDAVVSIYGRNVLLSHGDRLGVRGGDGGAGVAAPAARGMRKMVAEYAARGILIDVVIIGHLHSSLILEDGFVSGTMVGPSEYSRDCRFKPRPACQWLLTVHPDVGVARRWEVYVGDPSEGSLYRPRRETA